MMFDRFDALVRRGPRHVLRNERGAVAVLVTFMLPVLIGMAGLSVDVGLAYVGKRQLQESTQAAALAGAAALAKPDATLKTVSAAVTAWQSANAPTTVSVTGATVELACDSATDGLPACTATSPNVVKVTQAGTVSTNFLKVLGKTSFNVSTTVAAAKAGGEGRPINLMIVLDVTGSMNDVDTNCTVPSVTSPTKMQCALYAIQRMLKVMPTAYNKVGLMAFPGLRSAWNMTSTSCGTSPDFVPYYTSNIVYERGVYSGKVPFDDTYNDGAGGLVATSPLVVAVGDYGKNKKGCLEFPGESKMIAPSDFSMVYGVEGGSSAMEVLEKAQAAFPTGGTAQNVIVFVSDGGLTVTYISVLNYRWDKWTNQCAQHVQAAKQVKDAGTTLYAVAWGALRTYGCEFDTNRAQYMGACDLMKGMPSDPTTFFTTTADCKIKDSPNAVRQLPEILGGLPFTLSKPRLLLTSN